MSDLLHTPLFSLHERLGAKMVPFAGYAMPVQYPSGILSEHLHTRAQAGLFDVSHMGQIIVEGEGVEAALEALLPVDLQALPEHKQSYAVFTAEDGGILDDLIITRWGAARFFLVVNAACKAQDFAHLQQHLPNAQVTLLDRALLALQGPTARAALSQLAPEAASLTFMTGRHLSVAGIDCYVTCSGYTGEDGFELSVANDQALALAEQLLALEGVEPIGLGARDSLRLEAGLCLYGHDMDQTINPIEASLSWSISKARRADGARAGGFPGADLILQQLTEGASRKRVALTVNDRAPVREGTELVDADGNVVGQVTSGGFAPTLGAPIAMGYLPTALAQPGTELFALVRGKARPVTVSRTPFVPQRYFRG